MFGIKNVGWIIYLYSSSLILLSCGNKDAFSFQGTYSYGDTIEIRSTQKVFANQVYLYQMPSNKTFFVYPKWESSKLIGINIEDQEDSISIKVPFEEVCKYGYWDIEIIRKDSILLIPDHRGEKKQELVLISDGKKIASFNIESFGQRPPYNYSGSHLNRLDYYEGSVYSNIFYQNYQWSSSGELSNPEMFDYPHHTRFSIENDSMFSFGYYPKVLKSGGLAHGLVLKARIDSAIVFCYMYQHEMHVYNTNNLSEFRKIDLAEILGSQTNGKALYQTERELSIESDLIQSMVYNEHQKRLYITYAPAINYKKAGGLEVARWTDKQQRLHVFSKELVHLGSIELPLDKGFNLGGAFPIKGGLLCPIQESDSQNLKYVKVVIP
jgi:hypothetical protein